MSCLLIEKASQPRWDPVRNKCNDTGGWTVIYGDVSNVKGGTTLVNVSQLKGKLRKQAVSQNKVCPI